MNIYYTILFFILTVLHISCFSDTKMNNVVGKTFKLQEATTLNGERVRLPDYFEQRLTLVAYGFSRKSSDDFDAVLSPFKARYEQENDIFFIEIPMLGSSFRLARKFIEKGMRKGIEKQYHPHVMTYFKSTKPFKEYYGITDKNIGYFVLVNAEGNIIWQLAGRATTENINDLYQLTDDYMKKIKLKSEKK